MTTSSQLLSGDRPPPTTAAIAIASAILAGVFGFFIGQGASLFSFSSSLTKRKPSSSKAKKSWPNSYDVKVHAGSSDEEGEGDDEGSEEETDEEEEEEDGGELATFERNTEEVKLVLVVRTDLGMGKGEFFFSRLLFWVLWHIVCYARVGKLLAQMR